MGELALRYGPYNSPTEKKVPNGLRFHLIDIYVDELEKLKPKEMANNPLPIEQLLVPFQELAMKSPTKLVRTRSKDLLLDERLVVWGFEKAPESKKRKRVVEDEDQSDGKVRMGEGGEEWGGIDD